MRIERNILSAWNEDETRAKATAHLISARYRQTGDGVEMSFSRGSILGSILSFSARGSMVQVYLRPREVENGVELETAILVSTAGRVVTKGERGFWEGEADKLADALSAPQIAPVIEPETFAPREVIPVEARLASLEVQSHISTIFALLAGLFCLICGWLARHSILGAAVGLVIGVGVAFVLAGAWMSRYEAKDGATELEVAEVE